MWTGSQRQALLMVGLARSSWHYRRHPRPRVADPVPQRDRAYPSRICPADRDKIVAYIQAAWDKGHSVDHAFATAWDEGIMLASRRTWWRIAEQIQDQHRRPQVPSAQPTRQERPAPVLQATGPGQVWSWDITDLRSPWRGVVFKAYKITDIFSRDIIGWGVHDRESDQLAAHMFAEAIAHHGRPQIVHSDNGAAMTSHLLTDLLGQEHGIELSYNRPYVNDDNPFSEAAFRTMKYRPDYPKIFTDLDQARHFLAHYVHWYNNEHKHSALALFSPAQVHNGTWRQAWHQREETLQAYYAKHPERFHTRPSTPTPAGIVGINLPNQQPQNTPARLHTG